MTSFARSISRMIDKKNGKIRAISLVDAIHIQALNPGPLNKKKLTRLVNNLKITLLDEEWEEALETFTELYAQMMKVRPRAEHVFHPSTLEQDCPRMLWYDINKVPKTNKVYKQFTAQTFLTFDQGTWFHHYAQQKLKAAGILVKAEVRVHDADWKIDGRADGDLRIPEKALLEIKTMGSFQFKKAIIQNKPFDYHIKQAGLYAHFLGYKYVVFLYFNKDTSEMKEFVYEVDDEVNKPLLEKMRMILDAKKPPLCTTPHKCTCAWKDLHLK